MEHVINLCEKLIKEGEDLLRHEAFENINTSDFINWQTQSEDMLSQYKNGDSLYYKRFKSDVLKGDFTTIEIGIGVLKAYKEKIGE